MSNHVHVVLHVDKQGANSWSLEQVLTQWHRIHKGTLLTQRYLKDDRLSDAEIKAVADTAEVYRRRLYDISWFMRNLNEFIARAANTEDECTGRFWEGRFKSQALLNESALLSCMAYVDLNPVRANIATTPENSRYTSIYARLQAVKSKLKTSALLPFSGEHRQPDRKEIPIKLSDYLELVDTTGRIIRDDKPGYIHSNYAPILSRLGISQVHWQSLTTRFEKLFSYAAGCETTMRGFKQNTNRQRARGIKNAKLLSITC
nr:transposase [Alteromonas stellipolaris]